MLGGWAGGGPQPPAGMPSEVAGKSHVVTAYDSLSLVWVSDVRHWMLFASNLNHF